MNINDYITFSLYCNVCRSLFEKHKLMFAFLVCIRILMNDGQIDMVSKSPWSFDGIPSEQLKPSLFDPPRTACRVEEELCSLGPGW